MILPLELSLLFGLCLAGQAVSVLLPFPMPSSVLAMAFLLLLLQTKLVRVEAVARSSSFLLKYLSLFLVPADVSLMESAGLLSQALWQLLLICAVTTPLTILVTYYATRGLNALLNKGGEKHAA